MFDVDPNDRPERILAYHPESDCYFVCSSRAEFEHYCNGEPLDDVTGVEHHEKRYFEQLKEEQQ